MIGLLLDAVLMLLLVAALGYGVRLEKKLSALRDGQAAFASAVGELNTAAARAEAALASLRASGQETDLLHDRIVKARAVKAELETLIARAPTRDAVREPAPVAAEAPIARLALAAKPEAAEDDDRARRMAALAERIQGMAAPKAQPGRDNVAAILGALNATQSAQQSLQQARRTLDEDLFAA